MRPMEPIETGRELALRMGARFPREDWIATLAERSGESRESVEWHLQEDSEPPPGILAVAAEMLASPEMGSEDRGSKQKQPPDQG